MYPFPHTPGPSVPFAADPNRQQPDPPGATAATGRDSQGRFTKGNPGGPGNPFYRRQAHLKRVLLEAITDEDVRSVVQVLLGLARGGDLVAIKLYLQYAAGKPAREIEPDKEELHEWGLQKQAPPLGEVMGLMATNIPTATANQRVRATMPIVADCHLRRLSQSLRDGRDFQGEPLAPPLEEAGPADPNGGKRPTASARRLAGGVRPADYEDGDEDDDLLAWFDSNGATELTGDIGDDEPAPRPRKNGRTGPGRTSGPGSE
jgi:hypothetical protein